ncbi:MAG: hypothetical protein HC875_36850 [Anaerolineales bacterium]|nr:hypothetical protein [Anaerolineales bacterium]
MIDQIDEFPTETVIEPPADIPPPEQWTDPGPIPYSGWRRWLHVNLFRRELYPTQAEWVAQYQAYYAELLRQQEEYERWQQQQAEYEALIKEYNYQGHHMAEMLPRYLHNVRLSHKRTVQDRKSERFRERVDYCVVAEWYFDESAYYFWIDTWDSFPYGVSVGQFMEPDVKDTLSVNFGADTYVEYNKRDHQRPGLWVVVAHKAGRGLIPRMIHYSDMLKAMPKEAPMLAFPVGVGQNGKYYYGDMDELVTVLVVGSRGAGKSNTINVILNTWLTRAQPEKLRLFLTDLKGGLEFYDYQGIPHLGGDVDIKMRLTKDSNLEPVRLGQEVLTDPPQVIPVLKYIEAEMNRRFDIMKGKAKKITAFNRKYSKQLSYWVLVVDELATLTDSKVANEANSLLGEIARKGRAVGIFMILATQIPDKTVLTRQVAGNMDCRLVGRVADGASSALSLGDGSWDATYLPKDVPGRILWRWAEKVVVQAPLINDLTVKSTIRSLIAGQTLNPADVESRATAAELFAYAHEHLAGLCSYRELFNHFRNRIPQHRIKSLLKEWEVAETGNGLGPRIPIEDEEYYLAPAKKEDQGTFPRQLILCNDFESDPKWLEIVQQKGVGQGSGVTKPGDRVAVPPEKFQQAA